MIIYMILKEGKLKREEWNYRFKIKIKHINYWKSQKISGLFIIGWKMNNNECEKLLIQVIDKAKTL